MLSIAGVALTASHGEPLRLLELEVNFGDALMLLSVVVYSGYTVALRNKPDVHWQSLMIVLTATAFVTTLPFVAAEFAYGAGIVPDAKGWAIIAYTAIFPSILSQVFYIRGVELIGANRAGLFINLVPIFGTLLSVIILGEDFRAFHAVAMALVFGGIWLAESSSRKTAKAWPGIRDIAWSIPGGIDQAPSHSLDVELQPLRRIDRLVGPHLSRIGSGNGASR